MVRELGILIQEGAWMAYFWGMANDAPCIGILHD